MAVALFGLTVQPGLSLDLQSMTSSNAQAKSDLSSHECSSSIDHNLMQTTSWLPQCEAATLAPIETFTEHLDAPKLITEAPILAA